MLAADLFRGEERVGVLGTGAFLGVGAFFTIGSGPL